MPALSDIAFGLAAGVLGWTVAEFFGKPFRRGLDLVSDARTSTILHANVPARMRAVGKDGLGGCAPENISPEGDGLDINQEPLLGRPLHIAPGIAAVIVACLRYYPAFVLLGHDECGAGFALRIERVESLVQTLFGGLAGVDRTAGPFAISPARDVSFDHERSRAESLWASAQRNGVPTNACL